MSEARRLPAPWNVVETPGGYVVTDATGQALAYTYGEPDPARRITSGKLSPDEARRVAANIAKLPALIGRKDRESGG